MSLTHLVRPARVLTLCALLLGPGCSDSQTVGARNGVVQSDVTASGGDVASATAPKLVADPQGKGPAVSLHGEWLPAEKHLRVTVWVHDFTNLLGLAGHLRYDPAALHQAALTATGVPVGDTPDPLYEVHAIAHDTPAGRILAGGARFASKPSPWLPVTDVAVSSELWLTIDFEVLQPGTHKLSFDPTSVLARSADGNLVQVDWGSANVVWGGVK